MSSHDALIIADFQQWRERFRRLVWVRGVCWVSAALVVAFLITGWLDFLVRPRAGWFRWGLTTCVFGAALFAVWKTLIAPLRTAINSSLLARILEFLAPHTTGERSLAAQLDAAQHSGSMQEVVIRAAAGTIRRQPSIQSLRPEAYRRPAVCLSVAMIAATVTAVLATQESWTAVRRVAMPWADFAFPQYDWLVLVDSQFAPVSESIVVDAHESLHWYVVDERGSPPESLWLQIRRQHAVESRPLEMQITTAPDGRPHHAGVIELSIDESLELRVIGGDDRHMPWIGVEVHYPPRITQFEIETTPPEYTARERSRSRSITGRIECLVGSQVEVTATFDRPLSQAWLVRDGVPTAELELRENGLCAVADWTVTQEGLSKYQFEIVGAAHARRSTTRHCEVQGIPDAPPSIEIQNPPAAMLITESASVPIQFTASDDIAVADVAAAYSFTMSADAESYRLPTQIEQSTDGFLSASAIIAPDMVGATVGDRLSVWAEATDRFNLGAPHLTRSPVRTLSVVSDDDKRQELDTRLAALIQELQRLQHDASQAVDALAELRVQVDTAQTLKVSDLEMVRKLMFETQSAARDLYESDSSVLTQVDEMRLELDWNRWQSTEIAQHLDDISAQLLNLRDRSYPEVLRGLALILDEADVAEHVDRLHDQEILLVHAWQSQHHIADTLSAILVSLGEFRRFGSMLQAVRQLREAQESLSLDAVRVAESTLGRDWSELSLQQQADLSRLAARQSQSVVLLAALVDEVAGSESDSDLIQTATVEILSRITAPELLIGMQQGATFLGRNDLGQALPALQTVLAELAAVEELLAGPATRVRAAGDNLQQTLQEFSRILADQNELLSQLQQADGDVTPQTQAEWAQTQFRLLAAAEQRMLDERTYSTEPWVQSARRAIARMRQAHLVIIQGNWDAARTEQQEAVDDVAQSIEQLRALIAERRQVDANAEIERLPARLRELITRQTGLLERVSELDQTYSLTGQWNRDMLRAVREAADLQQKLAEDSAVVLTALTPWPAFHFALDDAMLTMHSVATRLGERDTGSLTQQLQQQILRRLAQILASLSDASLNPQASPEPPSDSARPPAAPDLAARLLQIQLLRELQVEVRDATAAIAHATADSDDGEQASLADRQQGLAELAEPLFADWLQDENAAPLPAETLRRTVAEALSQITAAADALQRREYSAETVAIQDSAIAALDQLLDDAATLAPQLAGQEDSATGAAQSTSTDDEQSSSAGTSGSDPSSTGAGSDTGGDVEEIEVQRARDRDLAIDVWGHLPPRAQQQLQADFTAEFLPEYDDWIRRYYEALAEEQ